MSPYMFDAVFLAVILLMFYVGRRRGAFRVLAGLLGTLAAWYGASALSPRLVPLTVRLLTPYALRAVGSASGSLGLSGIMGGTASVTAAAPSASASLGDTLAGLGLPDQLAALAERLRVSGSLLKLLPGLGGDVDLTELMAEALARKIAPFLTFAALFIIIKLGIWLCVKILSLDWPIIGALNSAAGGFLGIIGGVAAVFVLCAAISTFGSPEQTGITSKPLLEQSLTWGIWRAVLKL